MPGNRGVAYKGPGKVEVVDLEYPELMLKDGPGVNPANVGRQVPHGAILKSVSTNICCSDQHMVRGRARAPAGVVLGHEITGEGRRGGTRCGIHRTGDLCLLPFNIAERKQRRERSNRRGSRSQRTVLTKHSGALSIHAHDALRQAPS